MQDLAHDKQILYCWANVALAVDTIALYELCFERIKLIIEVEDSRISWSLPTWNSATVLHGIIFILVI